MIHEASTAIGCRRESREMTEKTEKRNEREETRVVRKTREERIERQDRREEREVERRAKGIEMMHAIVPGRYFDTKSLASSILWKRLNWLADRSEISPIHFRKPTRYDILRSSFWCPTNHVDAIDDLSFSECWFGLG